MNIRTRVLEDLFDQKEKKLPDEKIDYLIQLYFIFSR